MEAPGPGRPPRARARHRPALRPQYTSVAWGSTRHTPHPIPSQAPTRHPQPATRNPQPLTPKPIQTPTPLYRPRPPNLSPAPHICRGHGRDDSQGHAPHRARGPRLQGDDPQQIRARHLQRTGRCLAATVARAKAAAAGDALTRRGARWRCRRYGGGPQRHRFIQRCGRGLGRLWHRLSFVIFCLFHYLTAELGSPLPCWPRRARMRPVSCAAQPPSVGPTNKRIARMHASAPDCLCPPPTPAPVGACCLVRLHSSLI
jgi:hypothetical protein